MSEKGKKKEQKKNLAARKEISSFKIRWIVLRAGWGLLILSLAFAVYKNFTAVDTVTVQEKETVIEKVENYSGIESFVENFARAYFTYSTNNKEQMQRMERLESYMQKSLADINQRDTYIRSDVSVHWVQVWSVEALSDENKDFTVLFTVFSGT